MKNAISKQPVNPEKLEMNFQHWLTDITSATQRMYPFDGRRRRRQWQLSPVTGISQSLEQRKLMTSLAAGAADTTDETSEAEETQLLLDEGTLIITGTSGNDQVEVDQTDDGSIVVTYGTREESAVGAMAIVKQTFDAGEVERIEFAGEDGDDTFINKSDIPSMASGGTGNDRLIGGKDADVLNGGNGNDTIVGCAGNDSIDGGDGGDRLFGGVGDDTLDGGAGKDRIKGHFGNDQISGGRGNDRINGGIGDDSLSGDEGNDLIRGAAGRDTLDGGKGRDRLVGGTDADELTGGDARDSLTGGTGNDTLDGGGSADVLIERTGDTAAHVEFGVGEMTQSSMGDAGSVVETDSLSSIERIRLTGSSQGDLIDLSEAETAGIRSSTVFGGLGDDTIIGSDRGEKIFGGGGDDLISGIGGADELFGNAGDDSIVGGSGNDRIKGGEGNDVINGGTGIDKIDGGSGNDRSELTSSEDRVTDVEHRVATSTFADDRHVTEAIDSVFEDFSATGLDR